MTKKNKVTPMRFAGDLGCSGFASRLGQSSNRNKRSNRMFVSVVWRVDKNPPQKNERNNRKQKRNKQKEKTKTKKNEKNKKTNKK